MSASTSKADLENNSDEKAPPQSRFAKSFERAVGRARWAEYSEKLWNRAAPTVGGLTGAFLTASWFGLWQNVSPSVRMLGVILFAAAIISAVRPLFKIKRPSREQALKRLDRVSKLPNRPASTYDDMPSEHQLGDPQVKALSDVHRKQIEKEVGRFKAGLPKSGIAKKDPFKLRYILALATAASFYVASSQNEVTERLTTAFNWAETPVLTQAIKVDAWITPPHYTKQSIRPAQPSQSDFTVPSKSILTLNVHDKDADIIIGGDLETAESACQSSSYNNMTKCTFELNGDSTIMIDRGKQHSPVSWSFNVIQDEQPSVRVTQVPDEPSRNESSKSLEFDVLVEDDHGADITDARIVPITPADPEAEPLPQYDVPFISIKPE